VIAGQQHHQDSSLSAVAVDELVVQGGSISVGPTAEAALQQAMLPAGNAAGPVGQAAAAHHGAAISTCEQQEASAVGVAALASAENQPAATARPSYKVMLLSGIAAAEAAAAAAAGHSTSELVAGE
jgi:hypothetical protein